LIPFSTRFTSTCSRARGSARARALRDRAREREALLARRRGEQLHHLPHDGRGVEERGLDPELPRLDAREIEQVLGEAREPLGVARDDLDELPRGPRIVHRTVEERLRRRPDRRDGRAQLVARVGHEVAPRRLGPARVGHVAQEEEDLAPQERRDVHEVDLPAEGEVEPARRALERALHGLGELGAAGDLERGEPVGAPLRRERVERGVRDAHPALLRDEGRGVGVRGEQLLLDRVRGELRRAHALCAPGEELGELPDVSAEVGARPALQLRAQRADGGVKRRPAEHGDHPFSFGSVRR
jgi:hypothetical protein